MPIAPGLRRGTQYGSPRDVDEREVDVDHRQVQVEVDRVARQRRRRAAPSRSAPSTVAQLRRRPRRCSGSRSRTRRRPSRSFTNEPPSSVPVPVIVAEDRHARAGDDAREVGLLAAAHEHRHAADDRAAGHGDERIADVDRLREARRPAARRRRRRRPRRRARARGRRAGRRAGRGPAGRRSVQYQRPSGSTSACASSSHASAADAREPVARRPHEHAAQRRRSRPSAPQRRPHTSSSTSWNAGSAAVAMRVWTRLEVTRSRRSPRARRGSAR